MKEEGGWSVESYKIDEKTFRCVVGNHGKLNYTIIKCLAVDEFKFHHQIRDILTEFDKDTQPTKRNKAKLRRLSRKGRISQENIFNFPQRHETKLENVYEQFLWDFHSPAHPLLFSMSSSPRATFKVKANKYGKLKLEIISKLSLEPHRSCCWMGFSSELDKRNWKFHFFRSVCLPTFLRAKFRIFLFFSSLFYNFEEIFPRFVGLLPLQHYRALEVILGGEDIIAILNRRHKKSFLSNGCQSM